MGGPLQKLNSYIGICLHHVHVAVLFTEPPLRRDILGTESEVGSPVRPLVGAAEDDHDKVIVGHDEGLGVLDGVKY